MPLHTRFRHFPVYFFFCTRHRMYVISHLLTCQDLVRFHAYQAGFGGAIVVVGAWILNYVFGLRWLDSTGARPILAPLRPLRHAMRRRGIASLYVIPHTTIIYQPNFISCAVLVSLDDSQRPMRKTLVGQLEPHTTVCGHSLIKAKCIPQIRLCCS